MAAASSSGFVVNQRPSETEAQKAAAASGIELIGSIRWHQPSYESSNMAAKKDSQRQKAEVVKQRKGDSSKAISFMLLSLWLRGGENMLEAISMKFLIASLTSALLSGQIVQMQALPGPSC